MTCANFLVTTDGTSVDLNSWDLLDIENHRQGHDLYFDNIDYPSYPEFTKNKLERDACIQFAKTLYHHGLRPQQ